MSLHPLHLTTPGSRPGRLESVALALHDGSGPSGPPVLVGVVGRPDPAPAELDGGRPDRLVVLPIPHHDPVQALLGFTAPPQWWAVGLVADAAARALGGPGGPHEASVVHLLDRRGTSMSLLTRPGGATTVVGPGPEVVAGRTADALRRILGLPTAPPPDDMTAHVVDLWLARVIRAALDEPGADWPTVVSRNPAHQLAVPLTRVPTPAALARQTVALGEQLDWDRYRLRCVEAGGTPFGELDGETAAWMDAGMFSRWMLGDSPPWASQMELVDALVSPGASERTRATIDLCPPPPWPPS